MSKATGRNIFWFVMGGLYATGWCYLVSIGFNFDIHPFGALVAFVIGLPTALLIFAGVITGIIGLGCLLEDDDKDIIKSNAKK
jgi:hypothetical protein